MRSWRRLRRASELVRRVNRGNYPTLTRTKRALGWGTHSGEDEITMAMTAEVRARIGEAGRQGTDVRSDLFVRYEPGERPLEIELQSRVGLYYGEQIREQAKNVLASLGV